MEVDEADLGCFKTTILSLGPDAFEEVALFSGCIAARRVGRDDDEEAAVPERYQVALVKKMRKRRVRCTFLEDAGVASLSAEPARP